MLALLPGSRALLPCRADKLFTWRQTLPIFLDRLADPVTAILLSITVVLIFGARSPCLHGCEHVPQLVHWLLARLAALWLPRLAQARLAPRPGQCMSLMRTVSRCLGVLEVK